MQGVGYGGFKLFAGLKPYFFVQANQKAYSGFGTTLATNGESVRRWASLIDSAYFLNTELNGRPIYQDDEIIFDNTNDSFIAYDKNGSDVEFINTLIPGGKISFVIYLKLNNLTSRETLFAKGWSNSTPNAQLGCLLEPTLKLKWVSSPDGTNFTSNLDSSELTFLNTTDYFCINVDVNLTGNTIDEIYTLRVDDYKEAAWTGTLTDKNILADGLAQFVFGRGNHYLTSSTSWLGSNVKAFGIFGASLTDDEYGIVRKHCEAL